ncbi:serine hydrolase [Sphingomonas sp.]|uniref:serine hydrolase domain-containing protein n=1 Tax=Sphingomonas sp. TaxID=28214 RepID=UPI001D3F68AD|nr:serine hydrolase [Sphingomonas sp.]MBX9797404.1 beta-lactamase family protein [Sphingomonas sp.]
MIRKLIPALALLAGASAAPSQPADLLAPLFAADQGDTRAAILLVDGEVVAKRYAPGYSDANRFISWSTAKTMTAMLVGELVADGKLQLDAPAPIAEWRKPGDPRAAITLRQLLNMASGLQHTEVGQPVELSDTNQVLFVSGTGDMAARAIGAPLEAKPGEKFEYSSLTTIILAEIVTRTLTDSRDPQVRARAYRDFALARLYGPAGVGGVFLEFDGGGTQIGGSLIHLPLSDFARMGQVLLTGRNLAGQEVIAPDWLAFMKTPSAQKNVYGGQTWLNAFPDDAVGQPPIASMNGHLGQYVVTFSGVGTDGKPHGYVLVRLGNTREDRLDRVEQAIGRVVSQLVPKA